MKAKNILEYIKGEPKEIQSKLLEIHETVLSVAPDSVQGMKWSMPSYSHKRIIFNFCNFKKHIGLFPGPRAIKHLEHKLSKYKTSKGTIQVQHNLKIPKTLIKELVRFNIKREKEVS